MIYSTNEHSYDDETIWQKCKNHSITLLLVKSSDNHKGKQCQSKIMGGLSPIQLKNYDGYSKVFGDN